MIRLRPSAHSMWLPLFLAACAADTTDNTVPTGSVSGSNTTVPPGVGPIGVGPAGTGSNTVPVPNGIGGTGGTGPVGPPSPPQPGNGGSTGGVGPQPPSPPQGGNPPIPVGPVPNGGSSNGGNSNIGGAPNGGTPNNGGGPNGGTPNNGGALNNGGNGGMPPPPPPEPSLVVSSQEAGYWQPSDNVTPVGSGNANFTVNTGTRHQAWHGWGGTFNERGWEALLELSETDRQMALTLLFDEVDGIGFDWGRIPIGPSDYAVARYTLSDGPGQFSISHDQDFLIPYIKAAQAVKGDVKYWASPWTPPPWAKSGDTANGGYDKGYFNTEHYQAYADFFVSWIQAYEAAGIPIDHVMPQNEPGWAQGYPTCAFGPATDSTANVELPNPVTLGTFVDGYLFPALDDAGLSTDVWFGTLSNNMYFGDYWNDMMSKASASRIIGAGLQWETQPHVGEIAAAGYLVMQSEHKCGNYPWLGANYGGTDANSPADANRNNFLPGMAPNNHAYGEESWDLMKSWIDDGVHIYSAWNMVLNTGGFNLDQDRPWPQNAMLAVDTGAGTLQVTAYYYVFRHLAQYVDAGATRVEINGDALAFENPDGSVVAVMRTTAPGMQIVSIDGTLLQFESTGNGWVTVNWPGQ